MSNEIAECTVKSHHIIIVQNSHLDFTPRFAIFMLKRKLCVLVTILLKIRLHNPTYEQTQGVCEFACH